MSVSLVAFWSPKGGSGTSVTAAACAIHAARGAGPVRLVDLRGDQPAVLGLGAEPDTGVADWLAAGPTAPTDALDRLGIEIVPGLSLVPRGRSDGVLQPAAAAEAGAALAVALRDGPLTLVDVGMPDTPAARALLEVADATLLVVRECYVALRRAAATSLTGRAFGLVVLQEPGRALGPADVAQVLGRPVTARVPVRAAVARAVDAGVLPTRLPEPLARAAQQILRELGLARGRAAA
jgi:cellulose biosynthesis protein BcsQ